MTWLEARAVRRAAFLFALALSGPFGCSGEEASTGTKAPGGAAASLAFDVEGGVLAVAPGQVLDVALLVPPGHAHASVWLEGDYLDASLGAGELDVVDGRTTVSLHAPTTPATFALHAKADDLEARLDVSVSASGFASLRVTATYGGHRPATEIIGSTFLSGRCDAIEAAPLRDGSPRAAGSVGNPIVLSKVPAGSKVAVAVRIGHYASGCVDLDPLVPDSVRSVDLAILDRPMALDQTALQAVLTFEPAPADRVAWDAMLSAANQRALAAFTPNGVPEAKILLDGMAGAAPATSTTAFTSARLDNSYDTKVTSWLEAHTPSLHDRASAYLVAGRLDAFGDLALRIDASGQPGLATVTLATFAALPADEAGFSAPVAFGWTADPNDPVHLSGSLDVALSKLVTRAADGRARTAVTGATTVADALATQVDCTGLAASLVGAGTSYPGCDASCTASLCHAALTAAWSSASDASATASEVTQISLAASAQAEVGEEAEPISFAGTWVGQVTAPGSTFAVKGGASALYAPKTP